MSSYKLYYFNITGRGELCRLIFVAAGQEFEDIRYENGEWPSHKAEMPLGQMPVLEFNGTKLPQSLSIARFLAKQFNLAGKDNFEQAQVDTVVDTINDVLMKFMPVFTEADKTKKQELTKKFFVEEFPKHAQNLEILAELYGNELTWADFYFLVIFDYFLEADADCLNNYPWLQQNRAEVEKQPRIAEHIQNRPKKPF